MPKQSVRYDTLYGQKIHAVGFTDANGDRKSTVVFLPGEYELLQNRGLKTTIRVIAGRLEVNGTDCKANSKQCVVEPKQIMAIKAEVPTVCLFKYE